MTKIITICLPTHSKFTTMKMSKFHRFNYPACLYIKTASSQQFCIYYSNHTSARRSTAQSIYSRLAPYINCSYRGNHVPIQTKSKSSRSHLDCDPTTVRGISGFRWTTRSSYHFPPTLSMSTRASSRHKEYMSTNYRYNNKDFITV